ncbi:C40 family peptidase [Yinghuangia aomiensis]|uniref:C40 family peptidase n=1 Tax=Yinghuangia aomiensis TaxID=676205 RepID=A0ABP9HQC3_9ACTN
MPSHRRLKKPSKARIGVVTAAAATAVALSSGVSHADPAPSKDQVKAQINDLQHEAEIATEELNGFQEETEQLQSQVGEIQDRIAQEQSDLIALQDGMGALVSAQYKNAGIDPTLALLLSENPDDYLRKAAQLDQITAHQAEVIRQIQAKKRSLDQERSEASRKLGRLEDTRKNLESKKTEVDAKLQKAQQLLNTLSAAERAALLAQEGHGEDTRASRDDTRTPNTPGSTAGDKTDRADRAEKEAPPANVPASGRAAAAIAAAKAKLGKPYVRGATGPDSFDCSGLTGFVWRQAGVSLPRTSQAQAGIGPNIPKSQVQPGDLIIYYEGYSHVAIYIGNGQIIHAPKPGTNVRTAPWDSMPITKIVRPS